VLVVITFVVLPACVAAALLFVVYGPVPARRRALAPRAMPAAPGPWIAPEAVAPPVTDAPASPVPAPIEAAPPATPAVPEPPPSRPIPTMNPALAPVVRHRADPLPPLRRAARGTDAPPPIPASPAPPRAAPPPIPPRAASRAAPARTSGTFDREEPTVVDG